MAEVMLLPSALTEFFEAIDWYQQRSAPVAARFAATVEHLLRAIGREPQRYAWFDTEFREASVERFPYSVIYQERDGDEVLVVAIAHASREPSYWRTRVE